MYYDTGNVELMDATNAAACDAAVMDTAKNGYRLPTEAEWEYAARGGIPGSASWGYTYAGGSVINDVAWYDGNSKDLLSTHPDYGVHPVGMKLANSRNLFDMNGNVWEWCWDWYASITIFTPDQFRAVPV